MKLIGFRKSTRRHKKYDAILYDNKKNIYKHIPFGDNRYQQFKDITGLNIYSHLDHNDPIRRANYRKRHDNTHNIKYSPSWFSWYYLW
jgi:hypothetical protein